MLTRAPHIRVAYEAVAHGRGWLVVHDGDEHFRVKPIQRAEYSALLRASQQMPVWVGVRGRLACWTYKGSYFLDDLGLRQAEVKKFLDELSRVVRAAA